MELKGCGPCQSWLEAWSQDVLYWPCYSKKHSAAFGYPRDTHIIVVLITLMYYWICHFVPSCILDLYIQVDSFFLWDFWGLVYVLSGVSRILYEIVLVNSFSLLLLVNTASILSPSLLLIPEQNTTPSPLQEGYTFLIQNTPNKNYFKSLIVYTYSVTL